MDGLPTLIDYQINNHSMHKLVLSFLLACTALSMFTPMYNPKVPDSVTIFDYSPDHLFLAVATDSTVTIVNGRNGLVLQTLTYVEPRSISQIAFSRDNELLAVGMKNGQVIVLGRSNGIYIDTGKSYKPDKSSTVKSICFSSDRAGLVLGVLQDQIVYWHLESDTSQIVNFGQEFVLSVSCSPTHPGQFAAGGGINTRPKVSLYSNNGNQTTLVEDLTVPWKGATQAITYSQNGNNIYIGNEDGTLYVYDTTNHEFSNITIDEVKDQPINKVVITANEKIIGLASLEKVFTLQFNQIGSFSVQQYKSNAGAIAVSATAGYAFIIDEDKKPTVLGQCPAQQYYVDETAQCLNCNPGCSLCQGSSQKCYGCAPRYFLEDTTCVQCSVGCLQCSNATTCLVCDAHFIMFDHACICEMGYYMKDNSCVKCSVGCDVCTDDLHCLECRNGFDLRDDACVCSKGTFLDGQVCKNCIRGCDACTNSQQCLTCSKQQHYVLNFTKCICDIDYHYVDDGQNCVCQPGFYYDIKVDYCMPCARGCQACVSFNECTTCKQDLVNVNGTCQCKTKEQYLDVDGVCQSCSQAIKYCAECESAKQCTVCQAGIHRVLFQGSCLCENGYFPNPDDQCQACSIVGCLECQDLQKCKTCDATKFWELDPATSQCKCLKDYSRFEDTCIKCGAGCKVCNPDQCLQCQAGGHWILDGGQCKCEQTYYIDVSQCKSCMIGCLQCSRGDYCDTCDADKHFQSKSGICTCQQSYFLNSTECSSCAVIPHCFLCVNSQTCTKCAQTFTLNTTTSKCYCRDGTYLVDNKCVACTAGCKTCTAADKCTSCVDGYVLKNGVCVQKKHNKFVQMAVIIVGVLALATIIFGCLV